MIYRTLGSTGEEVSPIGVGGWHLGLKTVDEQLAMAHGYFEPFKTSSIFDSTAENPQWLGEEPVEIRELMPA